MSDVFDRLGLRRVINASGTETPYGASPVRPEVLRAVDELAPHSVLMIELQEAASGVIARAAGSEAGCVTGCTAASISIAVAAAMTGRDLGRVEQLPDTRGMKTGIVMQKGHEISYGHHVSQCARLAGGRVIEIGASTQTGAYQLRHALDDDMAAALYVVSHLTPAHGMIPLERFVEICHAAGVPVIVDAASMPDPRPYVKAGADLVLWSAQKAFKSFTAGIVAGTRAMVHACLYQDHGIGRPMKVGKEGVIAAIAALEAWMARDPAAEAKTLDARMAKASARLGGIAGVATKRLGRQLEVTIDAGATGIAATAVAAWLAAGDPMIVVWDHHALSGRLLVNLANVSDAAAELVCERIAAALAGAARGHETRWVEVADAFERRTAGWSPRPA